MTEWWVMADGWHFSSALSASANALALLPPALPHWDRPPLLTVGPRVAEGAQGTA